MEQARHMRLPGAELEIEIVLTIRVGSGLLFFCIRVVRRLPGNRLLRYQRSDQTAREPGANKLEDTHCRLPRQARTVEPIGGTTAQADWFNLRPAFAAAP